MGDQMPAFGITFGPAALAAFGRQSEADRMIAEETAAIRLTAVTVPELLPAAMEEVRRRVAVLRSLTAALDSVADDMIHGRWA